MSRARSSFPLRTTATCLVAASWLLVPTLDAHQQAGSALYLVSGYPVGDPNAQVATRIYRMSWDTKAIGEVLELVPASDSTDSVRAYHDKRLLTVVTPHGNPTRVVLLNMDDPCRPRFVDVKNDAFVPIYTYLLDVPHKGPYFAEMGFSNQESRRSLFLVNLVTGQRETLDADALRYARPSGLSAIGIEDHYSIDLLIDATGSLLLPWNGKERGPLIDIGLPPLPLTARPGTSDARYGSGRNMGFATWFVGTADFDLIYPRLSAANPKALRYLLFDKTQKVWRDVLVPGESPTGLTQLKPFGSWLSGVPVGKRIESFTKELIDRVKAEKRERDFQYSRLLVMNPKAELFLYNVKTGRDYVIPTGDVESEVLLVDDDVVYYRVKSRMYRADLRQGRTGAAEFLCEDAALKSVYWAFTGPVCEAAKKQGQK